MTYTYRTQGTCSQAIEIEIDDNGLIGDVTFYGGCNGNLKGIARLVKGLKPADVAARLEGVRCGMKTTSCPDQLARALKSIAQ
ncbi:MAG: TIGR03905 family TSCPD domain-containing protein [Muribaculaceae bacterium]|nr:TIGR03905 family TSCPD domain-containing protein [Muribaculaceae bacterium]